ncbi:MAG: ATP-binding protein, partial [Chloroflexota bacterium]
RCDPEQFTFETTAELEDLTEVIGQARAVEAVRFGVGMRSEGYNLFALGPYGTGKHTAVAHFLKQKAAEEPAPPDWCYVHNFSQPHRPNALQLPAGQGNALGEDMRKFVEELFTVLPVAFGGEDYQSQKKAVEEEFKEKQESAFEELKREARERDIVLIPTPNGLAFAPLHKGEVISPDDFLKLPDEEQKRVETEVAALQEQLQKILYQLPQWKRESQARLKTLNQEVARFAATPLIEELRAKYAELPDVLTYLQSVQEDVVEHTERLLEMQEGQAQSSPGAPPAALMTRYQVNVVVSNSRDNGAPVIYEDHPTYQNLIGRVEHLAEMGVLTTDFTLIKPGVLHRANGGYVILDALKVLQQPYAWEGLKRALRSGEITIESLGQIFSLISTVSLTPQPIPLNVKIVLLGERLLYYLLCQFDPDFMELFKVAVDFEDEIERSDENYRLYARLIGTLARKEKLPHFDRRAVARVLEHSSRLAEDSEKLSTHMQQTADLLRESGYWARQAGRELVQAEDVQRAIDAATFRHGRIRERMQEAILRETVLIDTTGATVGQINGLSVIALGNATFGRPSRITARVRLGKGEVVDIERQVELGGPIHSKGVLILSSFLASRYAAERPLSLSASLVFEQSYSGVEGDSASSAELYALLSALAGAPIKQSLAVTGSVNQRGQVQAIGGVNEKIEGFFDICQARGLTGDQGVLIPQANVKHLMLRPDVVAASAAGQFHVYPVETIDQGIELLTGVPAGEPDEEGHYPAGTINYRVEARLVALAEKMREFEKERKES